MTFTCIIPARFASSRFPGKPLCDLAGKPMMQRVYERALLWGKWEGVYIATDDERIRVCCEERDIPCIMTASTHTDCLDRVHEAASHLDANGKGTDRYITIQGDEPLFDVATLDVDLTPEIVN